MTICRLALFAAVAATLLAGCATTSAPVSIADTIARDPQLSKNQDVRTAEGATLSLSKAGSMATVDDAMVATADLDATNGVVHTIDRVLLPPRR